MEKAIRKYWPVFVLPTLAAFIIGFLWPFAWGVYLSFCKFTTVKDVTFVGLQNYKNIWIDNTFTHAFVLTIVFTVVSVVLINLLAFSLALLLTRRLRGTNVFRTIFFIPNLIGGIVLGYIWSTLLDGVMTLLSRPLLKLDATTAFWGLVILMCWQQIGYMMIIYIAGLQNVPLVMPSITICLFLSLTNAFKLFDQNLSLTNGQPGKDSQLLALNIYDTFYGRSGPQWKGIGQAKAVVFFIVVAAIALIQLRATRSKEVQQ